MSVSEDYVPFKMRMVYTKVLKKYLEDIAPDLTEKQIERVFIYAANKIKNGDVNG